MKAHENAISHTATVREWPSDKELGDRVQSVVTVLSWVKGFRTRPDFGIDDLVQEVWMGLRRNRDMGKDPPENLNTWIRRIAYYTASKKLRDAGRLRRRLEEYALFQSGVDEEDPSEFVERNECELWLSEPTRSIVEARRKINDLWFGPMDAEKATMIASWLGGKAGRWLAYVVNHPYASRAQVCDAIGIGNTTYDRLRSAAREYVRERRETMKLYLRFQAMLVSLLHSPSLEKAERFAEQADPWYRRWLVHKAYYEVVHHRILSGAVRRPGWQQEVLRIGDRLLRKEWCDGEAALDRAQLTFRKSTLAGSGFSVAIYQYAAGIHSFAQDGWAWGGQLSRTWHNLRWEFSWPIEHWVRSEDEEVRRQARNLLVELRPAFHRFDDEQGVRWADALLTDPFTTPSSWDDPARWKRD